MRVRGIKFVIGCACAAVVLVSVVEWHCDEGVHCCCFAWFECGWCVYIHVYVLVGVVLV